MTAPAVAAALRPVSLEEVNALAPLTLRSCRKYVVPASLVPVLVDHLAPGFGVLGDGGRTVFRYSSTYLDTPDLLTFRQHRQGRRRRFKIRTRSYLDSGLTMLEVKLKGARGVTDKRRTVHDGRPGELTPAAARFLRDVMDGYGAELPRPLRVSAVTDYRRTTLVAFSGAERVTCDTGLVCAHAGQTAAMREDLALLEVKTRGGVTGVERLLHRHGLRPVGFSKYAAAVAVVNPGLGGNRWSRVLRRCFDRL
ncbi:polyphosphate polymerase domain-containing protein [Thermobifida halotolerans]|uniref:Polyphosphate polymerase domain-containing protein n=1 Tax=Thermobifida halotolerans TaxID=483545 RepID=A0A399G6T3_9ACTN|nr:polyphosphate polymerase domain-containing protein [Thermobifida halotolerans]UOE20450.1 polyphosphate polymerase domain-containing protein [Thermobifida halotolerans]